MQLKQQLKNPKIWYVIINILVSTVGFARSFMFMKWLDMNALGIISLVQTIIMFLGLFQIGLLNGGYRIFALDKVEEQKNINNLLFTYIGILSCISMLFWLVLVASDTQIIISNDLMLVSLICGLFTLTMNWLTNTLIGKRLIKSINDINLISALCSVVLLPLVALMGTYGAVIVLTSQPLIFIIITLIKHKELRPTQLYFNIKEVKRVLSFGFIPFISGISILVNLQIERWSIAEFLSVEALGQFYLLFLYITLFMLVPNSINSIFFPIGIKSFEDKDYTRFKEITKRYTLVILLYMAVVLGFTFLMLQPMVDMIFPNHSSNTIYVYYAIPGIILTVLCGPISLVMNAMVILRPMLLAGVASIVTNIVLIFGFDYFGYLDLVTMTFIKNLVSLSSFIFYAIFIIQNRRIFKLRNNLV